MKQTLFALGLAAGCVFAATRPVSVDVFTSGSEGYHTFRIPAIVTA